MGAVFAGAARAPITAVLIIFELTGDYTIILPLMAAIVLATGVSTILSTDTIYTLKLFRRGIDLLRGKAANPMQLLTVANAMQPTPAALTPGTPLNAIIDRLATEGRDALPVVDADRIYRGTVTARDVEDSARDNASEATAATLARAVPILHPDQGLEHALRLLVRQDRSGLPVTSGEDGRVVGCLTHRDVLAAYNTRLHQGVAQAQAASKSKVLTAPTSAATSSPRPGGHRNRRHPTRPRRPADPACPRKTCRPRHRASITAATHRLRLTSRTTVTSTKRPTHRERAAHPGIRHPAVAAIRTAELVP